MYHEVEAGNIESQLENIEKAEALGLLWSANYRSYSVFVAVEDSGFQQTLRNVLEGLAEEAT